MGSTTLAPGESTQLKFTMNMSKGMGGMHLFEADIASSDPSPAVGSVQLRANYLE